MSSAVNATTASFPEDVLAEEGLVLVDFWAPWCGPCRAVSPILDQIAEENPQIKLVKVNVDENPELLKEYGISSIPAFKLFKAGEVVKSTVGAKPKPAILADYAEFIG